MVRVKAVDRKGRAGRAYRTTLREFLARHDYTSDTRTVLVVGGVDTALE